MQLKILPCSKYFQWTKISAVFLLCITISFYALSQDTTGTNKIMASLPNPLVMANGTPVTTIRQWNTLRRPELLKIFTQQMYGQSPGRPNNMHFRVFDNDPSALGGLATRKQVTVFLTGKPNGPQMNILIYLPNQVKGPAPIFVGFNFHGNQAITKDSVVPINPNWMYHKDKGVINNHVTTASRGESIAQWPLTMILQRGYGVATMYAGDITPDYPGSDTIGVQAMYPKIKKQGDNFAGMSAWAWGLSRAMDYFETDPQIDTKKVIVFGTSRMGKAALWAGATDQRFAMVISNESGAGGAKLFHHWYQENIHRLCTVFPQWFCHNFRKYIGRDTVLPFDQNMMLALIAPRPLLIASAVGAKICDPYGEFLGAKAVGPVYRLLGTKGLPVTTLPAINHPDFGQVGYYLRAGKHDITPYDWQQFINFADMHLGVPVMKPTSKPMIGSVEQRPIASEDTIFVKGTHIAVAIGPPSDSNEAIILTPKPGPAPHINGSEVYGCRPGNPFIYRIPTTGERPMQFAAKGLPAGLKLDKSTGIITGFIGCRGTYNVILHAKNKIGKDSRSFKILSGDKLALTPPMGWNDWYAHYDHITEKMMRQAANLMVSNGMADAGYQYVDIDDCWMNAKKNKDPGRVGPPRDSTGNILPNSYFPDMKGLTDYIHSKGLKAGIYTSPGPTTCGGFTGSFGYEAQDAKQFANWGFDFLKYDFCSYRRVEKQVKTLDSSITDLQQMQRPYFIMGALLKSQKRDIVFNLCQYGRDKVWTWGAEAGGNSWRTAGDLGFGLNHIFDVALKDGTHGEWSKPGAWNDPDYIQIGYVGSARGEGLPELTRMPPKEQYSFMSLWCLLSAPLFYSGDLTKLNAFTLNILCNPEVIAVDQDPLGKCARVIKQTKDTFIMVKDMQDGSKAVGLCNKGDRPAMMTVTWLQAGITGVNKTVRDLWREKDLGVFQKEFTAPVPPLGVVLVRISKTRKQ